MVVKDTLRPFQATVLSQINELSDQDVIQLDPFFKGKLFVLQLDLTGKADGLFSFRR